MPDPLRDHWSFCWKTGQELLFAGGVAPEPGAIEDEGDAIGALEGGSEGGGALADALADPIAPLPTAGAESVCGGVGTEYPLVALFGAAADESLLIAWTADSLKLGELDEFPQRMAGFPPPGASRSLGVSESDVCSIPPLPIRDVLGSAAGLLIPMGLPELLPIGGGEPLPDIGIPLPPVGGIAPRLDGGIPPLFEGIAPGPAGGIPPLMLEPRVLLAALDEPVPGPLPSVEDWPERLLPAPLAIWLP